MILVKDWIMNHKLIYRFGFNFPHANPPMKGEDKFRMVERPFGVTVVSGRSRVTAARLSFSVIAHAGFGCRLNELMS